LFAKAPQQAHIYFLQLKPSHAIRSEVFAFMMVSTLLDQVPFDFGGRLLTHGSLSPFQHSLAVLSVAGGGGTEMEILHMLIRLAICDASVAASSGLLPALFRC
jgi:hypothetical protein